LETFLRAQGRDIEIANLGSPGAGPIDYAELAPRALRLLRPGVLMIAVVQADDVLQCSDPRPEPPRSWRQRLGARLTSLLPNPSTLAGNRPSSQIHYTAQDMRDTWKKQAHNVVAALTPAEHARFDLIPARIRDLFVQGDINPGIITYAFTIRHFMPTPAISTLPRPRLNCAS
jgi:hypothetical protein